jgi:hypothetical protein
LLLCFLLVERTYVAMLLGCNLYPPETTTQKRRMSDVRPQSH